jgi:ribonuclease T1
VNGRAPLAIACFVVGVLVGVLLPIDLIPRDATLDGRATTSPTSPPAVVLTPPVGLPSVDLDSLPAEAAVTVALIESGGPFPFRQDGAIFENREGLLPDRPEGHYREYTVARAGSQGRGPLRIVTGADGELYWSADHYASFAWIAR